MELFFEIFLAAMAVFGLWCALRLLSYGIFGSPAIGTVIEVLDRETAARLSSLLEEVRYAPFGRRKAPLIVLYSADLCLEYGAPDATEQALIAHYGGRWYVVEAKHKETDAGVTGE